MPDSPAPPALRVHIRSCYRRDLPEILSTDHASFPDPWTESDYLDVLRLPVGFCMVAEYRGLTIGHMLYRLCKAHGKFYIDVLRFAVHPEYRGQGVGRRMAGVLVNKLSPERRTKAVVMERDGNLPGHLFWATQGFKAVDVIREYWRDSGEDGYRFEYQAAQCERDMPAGSPRPISPALGRVYDSAVGRRNARRFQEGRDR